MGQLQCLPALLPCIPTVSDGWAESVCTAHVCGNVQLMSAKLSGRILKAAREQQEEIDAEDAENDREPGTHGQVSVHVHGYLR